jgi:Transposase
MRHRPVQGDAAEPWPRDRVGDLAAQRLIAQLVAVLQVQQAQQRVDRHRRAAQSSGEQHPPGGDEPLVVQVGVDYLQLSRQPLGPLGQQQLQIVVCGSLSRSTIDPHRCPSGDRQAGLSLEDQHEIRGVRRAGEPRPALGICGLDRHAMSNRHGPPAPTVPPSSQQGGPGEAAAVRRHRLGDQDPRRRRRRRPRRDPSPVPGRQHCKGFGGLSAAWSGSRWPGWPRTARRATGEAMLDASLRAVVITPRQVKALRSRYRAAGAKSDAADALLLADVQRTDGHRLAPLCPDSDATIVLVEQIAGDSGSGVPPVTVSGVGRRFVLSR